MFKIKTTAPKKYCVRPNSGILEPNKNTEIASKFLIIYYFSYYILQLIELTNLFTNYLLERSNNFGLEPF